MYGPLVRTVSICYAVAVVCLKKYVYKVFLPASILSESVSILSNLDKRQTCYYVKLNN